MLKKLLKKSSVVNQLNKQNKLNFTSKLITEEERFHYKREGPKIEDHAYVEYKKYPYHISHNDPKNPGYIYSERDEEKQHTPVKAYNDLLDKLKNDIKMQEHVYDILNKMDRPYKRGIPGIHKNITGGLKEYGELGDLGFERYPDNSSLNDSIYRNEDRWLNQTVFTPKIENFGLEEKFEKWREERPVNKNFQPDKGYKYDVLTPQNEKHPYVADRLGHPELLGTPAEWLLRLEGDLYHPTFIDQPFIQMPPHSPDPSLNFEEGEVIYENFGILEWFKFFKLSGLSAYIFFVMFVPYQLIINTHLAMPSAYDNLFLPYYQQSYYNFDFGNVHIPVVGAFVFYGTYILMALHQKIMSPYVLKMSYSKDKELLFVTRVSNYGSTEESVYEMAHLELMPPSVKSGVPMMSFNDHDGLIDVTCLNSMDSLVLYQEDKYWNPKLKNEFVSSITQLWSEDYIPIDRDKINDEKLKSERYFFEFGDEPNEKNEEEFVKKMQEKYKRA